MIFRNYLTASVLLVVSFASMHFYEASVRAELDAHNYVMREIVEEQKLSLSSMFSHGNFEMRNMKKEFPELKNLELDYNYIKENTALKNSIYADHIDKILKKYDVDFNTSQDGKYLSYYTQYSIYNKMLDRLDGVFKMIIEREKLFEGNDRYVFIKERESAYDVNEEYILEFEDVRLYNNYLEEAEISIELNGNVEEIRKFPYEIDRLPDSIALEIHRKNSVTGEVYNEREVLKLKP